MPDYCRRRRDSEVRVLKADKTNKAVNRSCRSRCIEADHAVLKWSVSRGNTGYRSRSLPGEHHMYTLSNGSVSQTHLDVYYHFEDLQVAVAFINMMAPSSPPVGPSELVPLPVDNRRAFYANVKLAGVGQILEVASAGTTTAVFVDDFFRDLERTQS